jgi:hypothetical protein
VQLSGEGLQRTGVAQAVRERRRRTAAFEHVYSPAHGLHRLVRPSGHVDVAGLPDQGLTEEVLRTEAFVAQYRLAGRGHRGLEPVGVVELPGVVVEQARAIDRVETIEVWLDGLQQGQRLPVRTGLSRLSRSVRCVPGDGLAVAGGDRVMDHPRPIDGSGRAQRAHDGGVRLTLTQPGQAVGHRTPSQLVPEGHRRPAHLEQPDRLGVGQPLQRLVEQARSQLEVDCRRDDRQLLKRSLRWPAELAQPGEHEISHPRRHLVRRRGEDLAQEEGVASGDPVQSLGWPSAALGQLGHRLRGQRLERDALRRHRRDAGQHPLDGMARGRTVGTERQHEDRGPSTDPAHDVAEHIERRVVGPVCVLDDQHCRRGSAEFLGHPGEDFVRRALAQRTFQRSAGAAGRVTQWSEGPRRQQVVASTGEDANAAVQSRKAGPDQAGLADASLAGEKHRGAGARHGPVDGGPERGDSTVALQQPPGHPYIVPACVAAVTDAVAHNDVGEAVAGVEAATSPTPRSCPPRSPCGQLRCSPGVDVFEHMFDN